LRNFGGNYATFQSQTKIPIGDAKVPLAIPEADLWASTNPNIPGISPHRGTVRFDVWDADATSENAAEEYLSLRAASTNSEAVRITGWSVESLISGVRFPIPTGTLHFKLGEEAKQSTIHLAPGEYTHIVTGSSPTGTSFHTNTCIGQLMNYDAFYPRLPEQCPATSTLLPSTLANLKNMGEECLEYISTIAACEIPREENMPADLLPACKAHIVKNVSYNQCVDNEYKKNAFKIYNGGGWYTYLDQPLELWRNKYDVIRLLDREGRVVDIYSY
jgi:hypothetical protein